MRVSSMRSTGVSSACWNPASTTSPMKKVWLPQSTAWRTSHSSVGHRLGEDRAHRCGRRGREPVQRLAATSTSTGLVNFRTMARSSRPMMHRVNTAALDQLVGERLLLHADADQLGLGAHLGGPVERHGVAPVAVRGCPTT